MPRTEVGETLAKAWKRKAKLLRWILNRKYKEDAEWRSALRLAGIGHMSDLNPDAIRLTIIVPREKRIAEMVEERVAAELALIRAKVEGLRREEPWPQFVTAANMAEAARIANNNVVDDVLDFFDQENTDDPR